MLLLKHVLDKLELEHQLAPKYPNFLKQTWHFKCQFLVMATRWKPLNQMQIVGTLVASMAVLTVIPTFLGVLGQILRLWLSWMEQS